MKHLLLSVICIALTGCMATTQNTVNSQYQEAIKRESLAWDKAWELRNEQCGEYGNNNPLPPEKAMQVASCFEEIINREVAPNSVNPIFLNDFLIAYKKISLDYQKNRIDRDEAIINLQQSYGDYMKSIDQQYKSDMNRAYQHDQLLNAQRAQAFQNLDAQIAREQQQAEQNKIKNTNCTVFGDTMNCTTW